MQAWSEITISEEAESGKKVSSVIQVPSQASTYVSTLLFVLSQEIGRVGGHAMDQQVLEHLSGTALGGVVRAYGNLLEEVERKGLEVPQPCALQLYFDLKYAAGVLAPLKAEEVSCSLTSHAPHSLGVVASLGLASLVLDWRKLFLSVASFRRT